MPADFSALLAALGRSPLRSLTLRRLVPRSDLQRFTPPNYLFTSGYAGRYNPDGALALYVSEDATTAGVEYERSAARLGENMQQVLYSVEASVSVLDLGEAAILAALSLAPADLVAPWEFAPTATATQLLGQAVSKQNRFAAIRFPSDAARVRGFAGFNLAIFPS